MTTDALQTEEMLLQMGPAHPSMHGTVRMILRLDGETIVSMDPQIGYLHRGFEKMMEQNTYNGGIPYTDRLNYVSPLINNVGYAMAVEKLLGIECTPRCKYIRVLVSELSRLTDHFTMIGASAMELGAFTPLLWVLHARDHIYDIIEEITGARITTDYTRVGGLRADLPADIQARYEAIRPTLLSLRDDCDKVLSRNRIFMDRMQDIAVVSKEDAIAWGFTGPCLRASGVAYDVRKDHPYLVYGDLDFEVPVGTVGDNYDRFMIRMEEILQSISLIDQVFEQMPDGPVNVEGYGTSFPPKDEVYNTIEGMIAQFKHVYEGQRTPPGEAYSYVEGGNGEVGFYVVSDGSGKPYRVHCRPPCFAIMQAMPEMLTGHMLADIIPTFDSINMIGGEIDR